MTSKKKVLLQGTVLLLCGAQAAFAGVNVNINLGEPPRTVVVTPPPQPVYVPPPAPVYVPPPAPATVYVPAQPPVQFIEVNDDIQFVYPGALGFYVAVGVPYDLFFVNNNYFLYRDGRWLRAPSSRGPWVTTRYRELPPGLRRHRLERIREFRAREYEVYRRDRDHYRGRHFRSAKEEWREQRRDAHEQRKEEHFREKEQRREEKRYEKEQRREEKRAEREERRRD
ncbi:hypothetical protein GMLC_16690 [Geomonas limicola]|uniref:Lipoprotein n=1 Tax=Geomonas limicola TaxID=2740186 RepID=A0A6V8N6W1_9BACT|nr:hypothetical protein [Geomonas limicola]GFO68090.1 hypothetical protein GMLC_16690 [Geomonas limicola]